MNKLYNNIKMQKMNCLKEKKFVNKKRMIYKSFQKTMKFLIQINLISLAFNILWIKKFMKFPN